MGNGDNRDFFNTEVPEFFTEDTEERQVDQHLFTAFSVNSMLYSFVPSVANF